MDVVSWHHHHTAANTIVSILLNDGTANDASTTDSSMDLMLPVSGSEWATSQHHARACVRRAMVDHVVAMGDYPAPSGGTEDFPGFGKVRHRDDLCTT